MSDLSPVPAPDIWTSLIQGTTAVPKSIAKLIDTVGSQIGLFLEPTHIRRKGRAEADTAIVEANAKAEIAAVQLQNKLVLQEIQDRAEERVRERETKRQKNIESITAQAAHELPESVSEKPVDEDWVAQFLNHCQDVSNAQMQSVWARLLAGEVERPGSFSLRTMELVRVMSKDDADTFTRFCSTVWQFIPKGLTAIIPDLKKMNSLAGINVQFPELVRLDSIGLIRFETFSGFRLQITGEPRLLCLYYGRRHLLAKEGAMELHVGKVLLTEVGQELAAIAGATPNEEYRSEIVSNLRQQGWQVDEL